MVNVFPSDATVWKYRYEFTRPVVIVSPMVERPVLNTDAESVCGAAGSLDNPVKVRSI